MWRETRFLAAEFLTTDPRVCSPRGNNPWFWDGRVFDSSKDREPLELVEMREGKST
jgi:hypothetical protein